MGNRWKRHRFKGIQVLAILAALVLGSIGSSSPTGAQTSFVTRSGTSLVLDGSPYKFIGGNRFGLGNYNNIYACGPGDQNILDSVIGNLAAYSVNGMRFWAFQSFTNGGTNWSAFDAVLQTAAKYNVRLVFTLENQWQDCTGGGYKYDTWYASGYLSPYGSYPISFRDYVNRVVTRYKDNPYILMWQLMNEAEIKTTGGSCGDATTLYNFAQTMSSYIKSIDPNHLVNLGTIGTGQCGTSGSNYQNLYSISTIDVVEAHDYGDPTDALPPAIVADLNVAKTLNKPFFMGEAGIPKSSYTLSQRASLFDSKISALFSNGGAGYQIWQWDTTTTNGGTSCSGFDSFCYTGGDPLLDVINNNALKFGISGTTTTTTSSTSSTSTTSTSTTSTTTTTSSTTTTTTPSTTTTTTTLPPSTTTTTTTTLPPSTTTTTTTTTLPPSSVRQYNVSVDPGGGRVLVDGSPITAQATYTWNSNSTHTLDPDSPYVISSGKKQKVFTSWNDGSIDDPRVISVNSNANYSARWKTEYYLNTTSPHGVSSGKGWYTEGTTVTAAISSSASGGSGIDYVATGSTLDAGGFVNGTSRTVTMDAPHTVDWQWKTEYQLTVDVAPSNAGFSSPSLGSHWYGQGAVVPLTASPAGSYTFTYWLLDGVKVGSSSAYTVLVDGPHVLTAVFQPETLPQPFDFKMSIDQSSIAVTQGSSLSTIVNLILLSGSPETLTLSVSGLPPGALFSFAQTTGIPTFSSKLMVTTYPETPAGNYGIMIQGTSSTLTRSITYILTVGEKVPPIHSLAIGVFPSYAGAVEPSAGVYTFVQNSSVTIRASPQDPWSLSYWLVDGTLFGNGSSVTLFVDHDIKVEAVFAQLIAQPQLNPELSHMISISVLGSMSSKILIDQAEYTMPVNIEWQPGSMHIVSVKPVLYEGAGVRYVFSGWIGTIDSPNSDLSIVVDRDLRLVATYQRQYLLSVDFRDGSGRPVTPESYHILDDGGSVLLLTNSSSWVNADSRWLVFSVTWLGSNVQPEGLTFTADKPKIVTIPLSVSTQKVRVLDIFGRPVSGASVNLVTSGGGQFVKLTDVNGTAEFQEIPSRFKGTVTVTGIPMPIESSDTGPNEIVLVHFFTFPVLALLTTTTFGSLLLKARKSLRMH